VISRWNNRSAAGHEGHNGAHDIQCGQGHSAEVIADEETVPSSDPSGVIGGAAANATVAAASWLGAGHRITIAIPVASLDAKAEEVGEGITHLGYRKA
jgi:hypothetical protein